jgi:putative adenylate-forming enzyme
MFKRGTTLHHFLTAHQRFKNLRGGALSTYQNKRASQIIEYVQRHSPFYRSHWKGYDLADWRNLPTVDKVAMMASFDTFNTRGVERDEAMRSALQAERDRNFVPTVEGLTVGLSSGTSGHRGLFLVSAQEQAAWAGVILARVLHGNLWEKVNKIIQGYLRVAFFLRSNSNLYESTGRFIQFRYFDLMTPLVESVARLNEFKPEIVIGPPSLLDVLADALERGTLTTRPKRLISVAELLEPQDQQRLEKVFEAPIHEIYQCTEGLVGVSCEAGRLHVQEDIVAVQYETIDSVDDSKRFRPILTDLWRKAQPIIRYELNDVWQLDEKACPCGSGFQVIKAVEGRNDDVCYFNGRPVFPDTIRRMILLASDEIEDYEAVQERANQLKIRLVVQDKERFRTVADVTQRSVETILAGYGCRAESLSIELGLEALPPGAKRRRVRNLANS